MMASAQGGGAPSWTSTSNPVVSDTIEQHHEREMFSPYSTLNEPVRETIMRDVRAVMSKLRVVIRPMDRFQFIQYASIGHAAAGTSTASQGGDGGSNNSNSNTSAGTTTSEGENGLSDNDRIVIQQLKDWDLWGPLVLCLALAILLSFKAPTDQASLVFAAVFCAVWVGGTVVTVNAQLLGGSISFFQCLCVLGYSIFPLTIAAFVIGLFKIVFHWIWFDLALVAAGFWWSIRTSSVFIGMYIKPERRFLALYPVFFFYTFLAWMILFF